MPKMAGKTKEIRDARLAAMGHAFADDPELLLLPLNTQYELLKEKKIYTGSQATYHKDYKVWQERFIKDKSRGKAIAKQMLESEMRRTVNDHGRATEKMSDLVRAYDVIDDTPLLIESKKTVSSFNAYESEREKWEKDNG